MDSMGIIAPHPASGKATLLLGVAMSKIGSSKAVEILQEVRPRASRASLKVLRDRGLISPVEVLHSHRFAYSEAEVRAVASRLAEEDAL